MSRASYEPRESKADYATPEGTAARAGLCAATSAFGTTGLTVCALGMGCHRVEDRADQVAAVREAIQAGVNVLDLAPNYFGGQAESAAGVALRDFPRDEVVVLTKVGNITHEALLAAKAEGLPGAVPVRNDCWHSLEPAWIRKSLDGSLARLGLAAVDGVLLHNPEFQTKGGEAMDAIYDKLKAAFAALEEEVQRGRVRFYGVSCAFYPLRDADPETLDLSRVMALLPPGHHFRVVQFPFNFAEPQALQTPLPGFDKPLLGVCQDLGIAAVANRPLDGFYLGCRGTARFSSQGTANSELSNEDVMALSSKLAPLVPGELAQQTVRTLLSVPGVTAQLCGMRLREYVADLVPTARAPRLPGDAAVAAVGEMHRTLQMFLAVSSVGEADHGTAKDFRLEGPCAWGPEFLNPKRGNSSSQQREEDGHALYEHSRRGDLADVLELVSKVHPDEYSAYDGSRALTIALRSGRAKVAASLMRAGASVTLTTEDGSCAIVHAATSGSVPCVQAVVDARGDVNARNEEGASALLLASYYAHADVVQTLLRLRAQVDNYSNDHGSPLFVALQQGATGVAELLRAAGGSAKPPSDAPVEYASIKYGYGAIETLV